jgi:hypothetical protein
LLKERDMRCTKEEIEEIGVSGTEQNKRAVNEKGKEGRANEDVFQIFVQKRVCVVTFS